MLLFICAVDYMQPLVFNAPETPRGHCAEIFCITKTMPRLQSMWYTGDLLVVVNAWEITFKI